MNDLEYLINAAIEDTEKSAQIARLEEGSERFGVILEEIRMPNGTLIDYENNQEVLNALKRHWENQGYVVSWGAMGYSGRKVLFLRDKNSMRLRDYVRIYFNRLLDHLFGWI